MCMHAHTHTHTHTLTHTDLSSIVFFKLNKIIVALDIIHSG